MNETGFVSVAFWAMVVPLIILMWLVVGTLVYAALGGVVDRLRRRKGGQDAAVHRCARGPC